MSDIVLGEPLASQIRREAEAQGMAVEQLIEAALRRYRFEAQRAKINAEALWWRTAPPDIQAQYAGEFVAVQNQQVVDHDRDEESLRQRIRARYGKTAILLTPADGRRELRIVSTRLSRA